ncbi:hypothetical protein TanjilG_24578 [Lupinus angustifolius]|uniref:DUF4378 domain-containing protein n=1 Tax=Lupinus angustifolius TaxID=3871 RepID=A0A4P1RL13_LUPAN|nr:PREDICTED: protein LONGIFOLIA 1 [Lupinus angustifolius]OIW12645.1 hypothetical protein TanjilG_24578 [Lupinus angustifolius]
MTTGIVRDQNLEKHIHKQMGCMSGFLHIFDRHQFLTGKRIQSPKRLPPSAPPALDSSPETEKHGDSPVVTTPSPERVKQSPAREPQSPSTPSKATLPLRVLEFKEGTRSSWKFSREAPRLSLDSRAVVDAKGSLHPREIPTENDVEKQRRSTSVIVRLMGLEPLPDSDPEPIKKVQLRRSASESRVSRDLPQYRFFDTSNNFQLKQSQQQNSQGIISSNNYSVIDNGRVGTEFCVRNGKVDGAKSSPRHNKGGVIMGQKKSFYDSTDFFPDPKHTGEIEKRLKLRGIDEPSKDLDTLKHILEALQLKGLLHSNSTNFTLSTRDSPIVVMKPTRSFSGPSFRVRRSASPVNEARRIERSEVDRNIRTQVRGKNSSSPSSSPNRRRVNDGGDSRRVSPVNSPRIMNSSRRNAQVASGSPRTRKVIHKEEKVVGEDELSTVSESSFSTSSRIDMERYRLEEYREGRNLLDRCDKLLNSIAEITAANELQPSPVSVLDSSFYRDDSCSPSPITKRCIDYKEFGMESEDEMWSAVLCSSETKSEEASSEDCDFAYVSEILRACSYMPEDIDIFLLLEKQQSLKGKDTSKASKLQRRLIFDTINEILNRTQQLPPWKAVSLGEKRHRIWLEFRRIREREESEELFEVICGVLKKDMAEEMSGWGEWTMEMGDVVLDMERLVFKDLIAETIQQIASFGDNNSNLVSALRRKLMF